jgi:8-oxo-dGTP pyrophosphatase MutT (NUDIX family)
VNLIAVEGHELMEWKIHGQHPLYTSDWVNLWLDDVELPDGQRFEHHVLRMPRHAVGVVVADDADRVLMLWRHRFITDVWGWEIPAGWTDPDEDPVTAARREVEEETGWRPGLLHEISSYHPLSGMSDLRFTMFRADGATYQGRPSDTSEAAQVEWIPLANIRKLVEDRQITDGPSLMGLSFVIAFPSARTDTDHR